METEIKLKQALLNIRAVINEAPSELISDTIWVDGTPIIDYIDAVIEENCDVKSAQQSLW